MRVPVRVDLPEGIIEGEVELPDGPVRLAELAWCVLGLVSEIAALGERQAGKLGQEVSCRKGCGACCRQLVPVSPAEAFLIAEMLESMPPELRARFRSHYTRVEEHLTAKGVLERLDGLHGADRGDAEHRAVAETYFRLGIPCPFLQNESCAVHPYRPAACREYLVTSPAENCGDPFNRPIRRIPISARSSAALAKVSAELMGGEPRLVPLSRALAWVESHPEAQYLASDGPRLLEAFLHHLHATVARDPEAAG